MERLLDTLGFFALMAILAIGPEILAVLFLVPQ